MYSNSDKCLRLGQMLPSGCEKKQGLKIPEITVLKQLFLQGIDPRSISQQLNKPEGTIKYTIKRLLKQGELIPEIPLNLITTDYLKSLLPPHYHITKKYGKGWCVYCNDKFTMELGSFPYPAYKKLLAFLESCKKQ
jgi:hypothetical protein